MARISKRQLDPVGRVINMWCQARRPGISFTECCADLAQYAGVHRKSVENWCYGVNQPKPANIFKIASFFDKTEADFAAAVNEQEQVPSPEGDLPPLQTPATIEDNDAKLIIGPDSLLKAVEETLRKSILDIPYFKLHHNTHLKFEWDPAGFIRIYDHHKYTVQNRINAVIDYDLLVGLWNVRGKWLDDKSATMRLACHCPNLPNDPSLNFEYSRPTDIETYERSTKINRNIYRPMKLPPREIIEVETEGIICAYPIDNELLLHFAPTGRFIVKADISTCPGLSVHAAPLHTLTQYFRSVPNQQDGVFEWEFTTGLLPQQGVVIWWEGTPPEGVCDSVVDRRYVRPA